MARKNPKANCVMVSVMVCGLHGIKTVKNAVRVVTTKVNETVLGLIGIETVKSEPKAL